MKLIRLFHYSYIILLVSILFSSSYSSLLNMSSLLSFKNSATFKEMLEKKHRLKNNVQGKILYQGWVKYFHFSQTQLKKPRTFFKNPNYIPKNNTSSITSDQYGTFDIPSPKHFYGVIFEEDMNFFLSRQNTFSNLYDSIHIDFIKAVPENSNQSGGIKSLGKFLEGYCIQIFTIVPNKHFIMTKEQINPKEGIEHTWLICTDTPESANKILSTLISIKIQKQHKLGVYLTAESSSNKEISKEQQIDDEINDPHRGPNDGYWVLLQDWSQCTLKCGGGKQVRQLTCIPPKKGGKNCQGSSIQERECNTQPCPEAKKLRDIINEKKSTANEYMKGLNSPIVKVMPISNRPQQYDKCHLKDTDALMIVYKIGENVIERGTKIPIRLVMNNKSIMAFQDEKLESAIVSFLLEETKFYLDEKDRNCFILTSLNKKEKFCQLDTGGDNFVKEWNYDFHLFKDKCKEERPTIEVMTEEGNASLDPVSFITQRKIKLKEENKKNEEIVLKKKIEETKALSLAAVMKESKLEEMLLREEEERQRQELEDIKIQIEKEENKKRCMQKAIREKELESEVVLSQEKANNEIAKIQNEAKRQIEVKRNLLKQKIQQMRQMFNRKKLQYQNTIQVIRTETANDIKRMTKKGNKDQCFLFDNTNQEQIDKVELYCHNNFITAQNLYADCKQNFCTACCENEFGEAHQAERRQCLLVKCNIDY